MVLGRTARSGGTCSYWLNLNHGIRVLAMGTALFMGAEAGLAQDQSPAAATSQDTNDTSETDTTDTAAPAGNDAATPPPSPADPLPTVPIDPPAVSPASPLPPIPIDQPGSQQPAPLPRVPLTQDIPQAPTPPRAQPSPLPPVPLDDSGGKLSSQPNTIKVSGFVVEGNTVFTNDELQAVLAPFTNRNLSIEQLEEARRALTLHYINNGYINSGAILPDQDVTSGIVKYLVIEGELTEITISGNKGLSTKFIRDRITHTTKLIRFDLKSDKWFKEIDPLVSERKQPFDIRELKDRLELLRQNPNIKQINAELSPGAIPGQSLLDVKVVEEDPIDVFLEYSNRRPPSVGAERLKLRAVHRNLTGRSDILSFNYGLTTGGFDHTRFAEDDDINVSYLVPITTVNTTFSFSYTRSDTFVVELPFSTLDIQSNLEAYEATIRQPFYQSPQTEFGMGLTFSHQTNQSFLLGQNFSLSPGAVAGEATTSVVRFFQDFVTRNQERAISARSTFSFGIDAFDSTIHSDDQPDSEFVTWLGQIQLAQRMFDTNNQLILRGNTQFASELLLPQEQFSVGGANTVRGYRENLLVRENGLTFTAEVRIPVLFNSSGQSTIELIPFFDLGRSWHDIDRVDRQDTTITSVGLGLTYRPCENFYFEVFYGEDLTDLPDSSEEHNLQDDGFHFLATMKLY